MLTSRAKSLTRSACKEAKMERFITKTTLPPDEVLSEIYTKYYEQECPIGAFPHIIQRVARTVHEAQNLPMEFLCFIACGILSGTVGKSFRAYNAVNAYTQDANLYMLGLGASSSGKSASAKILGKRLLSLEMEARLEYREKLLKKKSAITKSIEAFEKLGGDSPEEKKAEEPQEDEKLEDPSFIVMNATSEAIAQKMAENGGTVFSLCAEARSLLAIVGGLYRKEGDDTEIYNSGWSGESIRQDRISRGVAEIRKPCLSILWLVQYDAFRNIMVKNENFVASGFAGRFLFFRGPKDIPIDKGLKIPLDKNVMEDWDKMITALYEFRRNKGFQRIQATPEAAEIFRKFHNEQVELMNNELKSVQELLGKARENAARLAIIFAIADETEIIDGRIAENACKVIKYSLYNAVEFYTSGLLVRLEQRREKMESILRKKDGRVRISYFQQFAKIFPDEIHNIVATFPNLYALRKESNGTYVLLKEVYPDPEAEKAPDEEAEDDDMPF